MACLSCGEEFEVPEGKSLMVDEVFDDAHPDVEASAQEHVQLECPNCGAVVGYLGAAAAIGDRYNPGVY